MQYKELDELYQARRTPWVPIILAVCLVGAGILYLLRGKDSPKAEDAATTPAATDSAVARPGEGGSAAVHAATPNAAASPGTPSRGPYPAAELDRLDAEALALERQDDLVGARERLLKLIEDGRSLGNRRAVLEKRLADLHLRLFASPRPMPGKTAYVIQPNDSLSKIAARFNCPVELIQKANRIANPALIRPGNILQVLDHPAFALAVDKRDNTLLLTLDGNFFKRYRVGTGEFGSTPTGTFLIRDKIAEPPWWHASGKVIPFGDPENILGTRWMALEATGDTPPVRGYGIHGTWDEASIGKASSAGCIRMLNADVEELFMLVPRGTPVVIR